MNAADLSIPSRQSSVSEAEWQVRVDLAAAYRLVAHFRWDDLVFTHITVRVPGTYTGRHCFKLTACTASRTHISTPPALARSGLVRRRRHLHQPTRTTDTDWQCGGSGG